MSTLNVDITVGEMVAEKPGRARVFEKLGVDYCCGGKHPLSEACAEKGLDPQTVLTMLEATETGDGVRDVDAASMSLTELADHIEQTHHAYLREELPMLDRRLTKCASVHGEREPSLRELGEVFEGFLDEIYSHMMKEEQILFPIIRQLEQSSSAPSFHCGSVANPIRQMEHEHDNAGSGLERMRELTDGFTAPDWACNTMAALYDGLATLERDMHQHIHKENNVLFPRAQALEAEKARG